MKYKIFFLLVFLLIFFSVFPSPVLENKRWKFFSITVEAANHTEKEKLIQRLTQQIEILKYEISLLRLLFVNMRPQNVISAQSYLAINLSNNTVLFEKNPDLPRPMASITKLMTTVIVLENINLNQTITLTEEMLKPLGHSPTLYAGLNVSAENLLKANIIQSTNDAAQALSFFLGKQNFISLMNQKAKELGMTRTVFYDAHGLNPKNLSTVQDLAKLLLYIFKNHPEILNISRNNNFWLPDPTGRLLKFKNLNNFYPLSTFIGGKTGYLRKARQTLASIFNVNGNPVAIILLYSNNHKADTFTILERLKN